MQLHFHLPAITVILAVFFALSIAAPAPDVQIRSLSHPIVEMMCQLTFVPETVPWLPWDGQLPSISTHIVASEGCIDCFEINTNRCAFCGLAKTETIHKPFWDLIEYLCSYDSQTKSCESPPTVPDCVKLIEEMVITDAGTKVTILG